MTYASCKQCLPPFACENGATGFRTIPYQGITVGNQSRIKALVLARKGAGGKGVAVARNGAGDPSMWVGWGRVGPGPGRVGHEREGEVRVGRGSWAGRASASSAMGYVTCDACMTCRWRQGPGGRRGGVGCAQRGGCLWLLARAGRSGRCEDIHRVVRHLDWFSKGGMQNWSTVSRCFLKVREQGGGGWGGMA